MHSLQTYYVACIVYRHMKFTRAFHTHIYTYIARRRYAIGAGGAADAQCGITFAGEPKCGALPLSASLYLSLSASLCLSLPLSASLCLSVSVCVSVS